MNERETSDFERAMQNLREAELSMMMAMNYPGEANEKRMRLSFQHLRAMLVAYADDADIAEYRK